MGSGTRIVTAGVGLITLMVLALPAWGRDAPGRGRAETEARVQAVQAPDIVMYSRYDGRWLKLLSGVVMLVLGLGLILRPGWLL